MKAVILAAGEGTRFRPLAEDKPKGMVEVSGKPILTRCLEKLAELGAGEFSIICGYLKDDIFQHYSNKVDEISITY
ncbi:glucose-1-phosphate thymidylyltransferase [Haloarcula japonica DSM 6131]|uniref:Glucose-1-phosphate thymidylyltransferase n=1 Tax=Haloarcula japonica (strain ATCC 49778 / DSM 6131 / JCM 7785 / NBRC 101032 / NCIMB 13157 / TR-1) TaxID=1227453 RepID=M0LA85_HALJT|nr:glucose-1-phosphate thymidylyltransferase [Haloarcula japonica DSM 6131]